MYVLRFSASKTFEVSSVSDNFICFELSLFSKWSVASRLHTFQEIGVRRFFFNKRRSAYDNVWVWVFSITEARLAVLSVVFVLILV